RRGLGAGLSAVDKLITDPEAAAARSTTAFATVVDGVAQDELVGGLGVAASAIAALDAAGQDPADCRAVKIGRASGREGAGARVVTGVQTCALPISAVDSAPDCPPSTSSSPTPRRPPPGRRPPSRPSSTAWPRTSSSEDSAWPPRRSRLSMPQDRIRPTAGP